MNKNWIEKYGEKVRKRKEIKDKISEKYWKLPALERIHYDSRQDKIENSLNRPFWISFAILKIIIILPLFLMFIGLMTGTIEQMVTSSSRIIVSLLEILPLIMGIDVLFMISSFNNINYENKKLNQRFKLIK